MRLFLPPALLGAVLLAALSPGAAPAAFLTLDNPAATFARPASGSIQVELTGRLSFDPGYTVSQAVLNLPTNPAGGQGLGGGFATAVNAANDGGLYVGNIVDLILMANTTLGFYSGGTIQYTAKNGAGQSETVSATFTVTVLPSGSTVVGTVPEPTSLGLLAVGLATTVVVSRRRGTLTPPRRDRS